MRKVEAMTDRIISLEAAISVVMEYFPGNTINDPKYVAGKSLVEALSALPVVGDAARIAELEAEVARWQEVKNV